MRKLVLGTLALIVLAIGGCSLLLPKEYAVNAPVLQFMLGWGGGTPAASVFNERIKAPAGVSVEIYAENLGHARGLLALSSGDLLLSAPRDGEIKLIERDRDGDGRADAVRVILEGLNRPHGMALKDGLLYVAETDAVLTIPFDEATGKTSGDVKRIITGLPGGGNHWTRTIGFGPDGKLYLTVGSSCNVCLEEDPRRAAMLRFNADGTGEEIYADGLRNTVGFDWQPGTGDLYGVDNGRDLLGDDFPPCELNKIEQGGFYGWPFLNGDNVKDPSYGDVADPRVARAIPPAHGFGAHTAPLSIKFLGSNAPEGYEDAALVTLHGSWNRSEKQGYSVVSLHWQPDGSIEERDFITGFEVDEDVIGRPVGLVQGADGAIYISDDYAKVVYRVSWTGTATADSGAPADTAETAEPVETAEAPETAEMPDAPAPDVSPVTLVDKGRTLFENNGCNSCHNPDNPTVKQLANLGERYTAEELGALLEVPPPPMPSYFFKEDEKAALAAYLLDEYN